MPRNFLTGIIDKTLYPQVDQKFYQSALEDANGFIITPDGMASMMPGTIYVANTKANVKVRLEKFIFSEDDVYVLEFGPLYIRFYRDDGQMAGPLEVTTTYTAAQIWELDVSVQLADTLYIFHEDHQRAKLVRNSDTSWTLSSLAMTDGPFRTENTSVTTMTASAVTGAGITLTASVNTFDEDHIGALFRVSHKVSQVEVSGTFSSVVASASVFVQRNSNWSLMLIPDGSWDGTVTLQYSTDNATWTTDQTVTQSTNLERQARNGIATDESIYVRVNCTVRGAGTAKYYLYANSYKHDGIVVVTAYTSAKIVTCTVLTDLISTNATDLWSEGCWSDYRGFPICGFFYANRIGNIGNTAQPQQLWLSEQNNFESYFAGVLDTSSFQQPLDGTLPSPVRWAQVRDKGIIVGTIGQVVSYYPQDSTLAARPTNVFTKKTSTAHANGYVRPVEAGSSLLMPELGGNSIMELLFSSEEGTFLAPDLTRYVKHLTRVDNAAGIVDCAFQRRPYPILWCVRSDGQLLAFLYDRSSEQAAWTKAKFSGTYESVTVVPKGQYDQVWLSSLHTINGSAVRFVCRMDQMDVRKRVKDAVYVEAGLRWEGGTATITGITKATEAVLTLDAWPVDADGTDIADGDNVYISGVEGMTEINNKVYIVNSANSTAKTMKLKDVTDAVVINSAAWTTYTSGGDLVEVDNAFGGLTHLEGEEVWVTANGVQAEQATVDTAAITLSDYFNSVAIGLYSTRDLIPVPFENGKTLGRGKHIKGFLVGAYRTIGGKYAPMSLNGTADDIRDIDWAKAQDVHDWDTDLFTGIYRIMDSWVKERARIIIQQTEPLPMNITMIEPNVEAS